jgi:hypothetical protein
LAKPDNEREGAVFAVFFPFFVSGLEKRENAYPISQVQSDSDLVLQYEGAGKQPSSTKTQCR